MIHLLVPTIRDKEFYLPAQGLTGTVVFDKKPGGYWTALNRMIYKNNPSRFVWLADDIEPHDDWLIQLEKCWKKNVQHNLGLVVCNDEVTRDAGAPFAMTTQAWLYVLFGVPYFPPSFHHYFLDTLIADRSKDLGRYYFCKKSVIEHMHWTSGKGKYDEVYENNRVFRELDKHQKDLFDERWIKSEKQLAFERLKHEIDRQERIVNTRNIE